MMTLTLKRALELLEPESYLTTEDWCARAEREYYIDQTGVRPKGKGECHTHIIDLVYWMKYIAKRLDEGKVPLRLTIYEDSENSFEREEGFIHSARAHSEGQTI